MRSGSSSYTRHRAERGPARSFWVTTRVKGCGEKVSALWGAEASSPRSLQPAGWVIYFTSQTSQRVWGSHALTVSLNVPFTCTESHFSLLHPFAPPSANPTPAGGLPSSNTHRLLSHCSRLLLTLPSNACLPQESPVPTQNLPQLFPYCHYLTNGLAIGSGQDPPWCLDHAAQGTRQKGVTFGGPTSAPHRAWDGAGSASRPRPPGAGGSSSTEVQLPECSWQPPPELGSHPMPWSSSGWDMMLLLCRVLLILELHSSGWISCNY